MKAPLKYPEEGMDKQTIAQLKKRIPVGNGQLNNKVVVRK